MVRSQQQGSAMYSYGHMRAEQKKRVLQKINTMPPHQREAALWCFGQLDSIERLQYFSIFWAIVGAVLACWGALYGVQFLALHTAIKTLLVLVAVGVGGIAGVALCFKRMNSKMAYVRGRVLADDNARYALRCMQKMDDNEDWQHLIDAALASAES